MKAKEEISKKDCSKCSVKSWYLRGYADAEKKFSQEHNNTIDDLELLIKEVCIPLGFEGICDELSGWDIDEDGESWCSRNCGKTNSGKCPEMNCYKEWLKMKNNNHTNGWILSSEKLPEIGQMCVCHVNRENYPNAKHDFLICEYVFDSHIRRWKDWFIAWMPILRPVYYIQDRMLLIDDAIKEMEGE